MTNQADGFRPGVRVRLKSDPHREGVVIGNCLWGGPVKWDETGRVNMEVFADLEPVPVKPEYGPGFRRMQERMDTGPLEDMRQQVLADQAAALAAVPPEVSQRDRETYKTYPVPRRK